MSDFENRQSTVYCLRGVTGCLPGLSLVIRDLYGICAWICNCTLIIDGQHHVLLLGSLTVDQFLRGQEFVRNGLGRANGIPHGFINLLKILGEHTDTSRSYQ